MTRTILFDLDGTLLDSEPDFTHILNGMLKSQGKSVSREAMRKTVSSGARAMVSMAYGIDTGHPQFAGCLGDFLDRYEALIPDTRAQLFAGIGELLQELDGSGCTWGIVTNKSSRFTMPLLKRFPAFARVRSVICADHLTMAKPDPEGLIRACNECGITTKEAVYVGDHPRDIDAARNAGMPGIAVTWGYLPDEPPVQQWQATAIIETPAVLLQYLQNLPDTETGKHV